MTSAPQPAGCTPQQAIPAAAPSPPRDLARAGATRRGAAPDQAVRRRASAPLLVIVPVALAQVLPLPDPNHQDLPQRRLPPLDRGPSVRHRPARPRPALPGPARRPGLAHHRHPRRRGLRAHRHHRRRGRRVLRRLGGHRRVPPARGADVPAAADDAAAGGGPLRPVVPVITFVIAIAQWPEVARLTRSLVLVEREKPYVAAARILGLHRIQILIQHIIPNVIKQATLVVLLLLAQAVLLESALSFLGAGPQRPFATWGRIISDGQDYITTSWWLVTLPGLVIVLMVVGVNLAGRRSARPPRRRKESAAYMARAERWHARQPLLEVRGPPGGADHRRRRHPRRGRRQLHASTGARRSPSSASPVPANRRRRWASCGCCPTTSPCSPARARIDGVDVIGRPRGRSTRSAARPSPLIPQDPDDRAQPGPHDRPPAVRGHPDRRRGLSRTEAPRPAPSSCWNRCTSPTPRRS